MKTVKYHSIDIHGNRISDIEFDNCAWFYEKKGVIRIEGKQYIYSLDDASLTKLPFDDAWYGNFAHGLFFFEVNKKMGFINPNGMVVLPPVYDSIHHSGFLNGEAYAKYQDHLLRIDISGKVLADLGAGWEMQYRTPNDMGNCYYRIENGHYLYYVADKNMENMHGPYKEAGNLKEGMRYLKIDENTNEMYVDEDFEKIFEKPIWGSYLSKIVSEGRIIISEKKRFRTGFLNKKGETAIEPTYKDCGFFSENRAAYQKGKFWGIMDENGKEIVPSLYDSVLEYSEGLARVCIKNKYGFIDRNGEIVIPLEYKESRSFLEGISVVGVKK